MFWRRGVSSESPWYWLKSHARTASISRQELQSLINNSVGGGSDVYSEGFSGAKLRDFAEHAPIMAKCGGDFYDAVLVIGGWGPPIDSADSFSGDIDELMLYCEPEISNTY